MSWQVDKRTSKRTIALFKGEPLLLVVLLYIYGGITKQIVLIARSTPLHTPHTLAFKSYLNTKHQQKHMFCNTLCTTNIACYALNP